MAIDPQAWTSDYTDEQMIEEVLLKVPKAERAALRAPLKARFKRGEADEGWRAWGGPNAGQVMAALTRALPSYRDPVAAQAQAQAQAATPEMSQAQAALAGLGTEIQQQPTFYGQDSPLLQQLIAGEQQRVAAQYEPLLQQTTGQMMARGATSGNIAAQKAALGGSAASALWGVEQGAREQQYGQQASEWADRLKMRAGLAGQQAGLAQGQAQLGQNAYQFGQQQAAQQRAQQGANQAGQARFWTKAGLTALGAASIPLTSGATAPYVVPAAAALWAGGK